MSHFFRCCVMDQKKKSKKSKPALDNQESTILRLLLSAMSATLVDSSALVSAHTLQNF